MPNKQTLFWFSCLSMLGFLSTDMYLPAFDFLQRDFQTESTMVGLSLSIFLLGMALGQLVYGPLSDRVGRKKVLLVGLGIFCFASVVCSLATDISLFLMARFLQALGACSASVLWQAVVVDRYTTNKAERIFATIMPLVALSPALAPLLGAFLNHHFGWRSIFISLVFLGGLLALMTTREPESANVSTCHPPIWRQLRRDYAQLFSSKQFLGNMLIYSACSSAFFAYLTGSPFMMTKMGYSGGDIGLSYVPQTIAFIIGGFSCRRLLAKYAGVKLLPWLLSVFCLSIVVMFSLPFLLTIKQISVILVPFCFLAFANGAIYPVVVSLALKAFKSCSATASGVLNFLQTTCCFVASAVVSGLTAWGWWGINGTMLVTAVVAFGGYRLGRKAL